MKQPPVALKGRQGHGGPGFTGDRPVDAAGIHFQIVHQVVAGDQQGPEAGDAEAEQQHPPRGQLQLALDAAQQVAPPVGTSMHPQDLAYRTAV